MLCLYINKVQLIFIFVLLVLCETLIQNIYIYIYMYIYLFIFVILSNTANLGLLHNALFK